MNGPKNGFLAELERDPWFMEERALHAFMSKVSEAAGRIPMESKETQSPAGYRVEADGTASIQVKGTLMKSVPRWYSWFDIAATSYVDIEAQLAAAVADPSVKGIRLDVDSHGGSSAGVKRAGDAIHAARRSGKPIMARVEDVACSAAYWLAAQTQEISAGHTAQIGSIGTYMTFLDLERMAKNAGVEVKVISSGPLKGAGVPGTSLTPDQEADLQKWVNDLTGMFVADVARGRGLSQEKVREWATGASWLGLEAKRMGLVDRVEGHQDMRARVTRKDEPRVDGITKNESAAGEGARPASEVQDRAPESEGETEMTEAEKKALEAKAAEDAVRADRSRIAQISAAYGSKAPELAQKAISEGWNLEQTKAAYADIADAKLEAAEKARKDAEAKAARPVGTAPVPVTAEPAVAPVAEKDFMTLSREYAKANNCSMTVAMKAVNDANPGLHEKSQADWAARAPKVHQFKQSVGMK